MVDSIYDFRDIQGGMSGFSRVVRTSFMLLTLLLSARPTSAQEHQRALWAGLAVGGPGSLGAEVAVDLTSSAKLLVQAWSGFPFGPHEAAWMGTQIRVAGDRDLHLYATPLVGIHQCYPAVMGGGGGSGCSDETRWRISAAAMGGIAAALSEGGPLSFGFEVGAWFVEEPGVMVSVAAALRYRFPL
jgi:hypothetical protein